MPPPYGVKRNKSILRIEIRSFRKAEGFNPQGERKYLMTFRRG
jgi:hypothetical protein